MCILEYTYPDYSLSRLQFNYPKILNKACIYIFGHTVKSKYKQEIYKK